MQTGQQLVGVLDNAGQPAMSRHNEVIKRTQQLVRLAFLVLAKS